MAEVRTPSHDFKVFLRRLVVPGELGRDLDKILLPSQLAGLFPPGNDPTMLDSVKKAISQGDVSKVFDSYEPRAFRKDVVTKAKQVSSQFASALATREASLSEAQKEITDTLLEIAAIREKKQGVNLKLSDDQVKKLTDDQVYYLASKDDPVKFSGEQHLPNEQTPRDRDAKVFSETQRTVASISSNVVGIDRQGNPTIGGPASSAVGLTAFERNAISQIGQTIDLLLTGEPDPGTERDARVFLSNTIGSLISVMSYGQSDTEKISKLNDFISLRKQQVQSLEKEIEVFKTGSSVRPFYEPILLNCMIGPYQVQVSLNRMGQPGTTSVTFHLPLDGQGQVPDLFMGLKVDDIFNLSLLEGQAPSGGVRGQSAISAQTLSILKANLRETTIQPFDMIQVWGKKRLSRGSTFPGDYQPIFTGFVTKTNVAYGGSAVSVTVVGEDVGKVLRLARVNIDPALDPRFRATGINVTPFNNVLNSPQFKTGANLIEGLIVGTPGTFLGLSQVEVLEKVEVKAEGGQTIPKLTTRTRRVSLASDFDTIKLNLFEDLLTRWKPYATQFKNAFRLWETDARTKWDICREVADVTEFEFYVDGLGVVNYHPPLYFLNPFSAQYFIEDVDIESESHTVDESEVLTVVEVHSQPSFIADTSAINAARRNDSLIAAPDPIIQRYGIRWQKKSVPIFSGTETVKRGTVDPKLVNNARDAGRDGYARAWMNRRNARIKSSTVTINGTPEIRMCNTVAFVGNLQQILKTVATNQMAAAASGVLGGASTALLSLRSLPVGAVAALQNVMVYYVTGVTHNYVQGGRYTTTLTLTHGRHWTDPLPHGSVGFSLDGNDTDAVVQQMRLAFGQDGVDADAFAREVNNKLQFIASGNPAFLTPQDSTVFGLTARPPKLSALTRFRNTLTSEIKGAVERALTSRCIKLSRSSDPKSVEKKAKDKENAVSKAIANVVADAKKAVTKALQDVKDFFSGKKNVTATLLAKLAKLVTKTIDEQKKKLIKLIDDAEEKALDALMGGKSFKLLTTISAGKVADIPTSALQPLSAAGVDISQIKSLADRAVGIAIFLYLIKGKSGFDKTMAQAEINVRDEATRLLKPRNDAQLITFSNAALITTTIPKASGEEITFIQGAAILYLKVGCP